MALLDGATRAVLARYEYSHFGEIIRATGPRAKANPFRFSTKFAEDETGLVFYGYRYFSPSLGRWISSDPSQGRFGRNLYAFCRNRAGNSVDVDGRMEYVDIWDYADLGLTCVGTIREMLDIYEDIHLIDPLKWVGAAGGTAGYAVVGGAEAFVKSGIAMLDAANNLLHHERAKTGSLVGNAEDFILHVSRSDTAEADLDALTIAIQAATPSDETGAKGVFESVLNKSYATSDAVTAWFGVSIIEDVLTK
jgi:RHS repeat-associated protein